MLRIEHLVVVVGSRGDVGLRLGGLRRLLCRSCLVYRCGSGSVMNFDWMGFRHVVICIVVGTWNDVWVLDMLFHVG